MTDGDTDDCSFAISFDDTTLPTVSTHAQNDSTFFHGPFNDCLFMTPRMMNYFEREKTARNSGLRSLISNAFSINEASGSRLTRTEIEYHLNLTLFLVSLTRNQQRRLGSIIAPIPDYWRDTWDSRARHSEEIFSMVLDHSLASFPSDQASLLRNKFQDSFRTIHTTASLPVASNTPTAESTFVVTKPPTNENDLQRLYLRSPKSIYRQIPAPTVRMTPDGTHAYVSAKEVCSFFFACRFDPLIHPSLDQISVQRLNKKIPNFFYSPVVHDIRSQSSTEPDSQGRVPLTCYIKEWSDDASKNKGQRGNNLVSFNLRTITFLTPGKNGDPRYYNFLLSLGLKGDDHSVVERIFHDELRTLKEPNTYYSGVRECHFRCMVELVAGIRDRIARNESLGHAAHNSIFGKRTGYAARLEKNTVGYISCAICHYVRSCFLNCHPIYLANHSYYRNRLRLNKYCHQCMDLEFIREYYPVHLRDIGATVRGGEQLSLLDEVPDDGTEVFVPLDEDDDNSPHCRMIFTSTSAPDLTVSSDTLADHWKYPTSVAIGSPRPPTKRPVGAGAQILPPILVSYPFWIEAYQFALFNYHLGDWTKKEFRTYLSTCSINGNVIQSLLHLSITRPHATWPDILRMSESITPNLWFRTDLGHGLTMELEAVFHCVHHGVEMNLLDALELSFGKIKQKPTVHNDWNGYISSIKALNLDYLQLLRFSSDPRKNEYFKTTGWIGTQKVGLGRILPYLMTMSLSNPSFPYDIFDEKPITPDDDSGRKNILRLAYVAVISFHCFTARFLSLAITAEMVNECREYIKLFITSLTKLQQALKLNTLSYISTGNVTSLLNVPDLLERYGSFRFFWDLTDEKSVLKVKGVLSNVNMTSDSWLKSVLELITNSQCLRMVSSDFDSTDESKHDLDAEQSDDDSKPAAETDERRKQTRFRDFRIAQEGDPLTGSFNAIYDGHRFFVPMRVGGRRSASLKLVPIAVNNSPKWIGSIPFLSFQPVQSASTECTEEELVSRRKDLTACVFLAGPTVPSSTGEYQALIMEPDQKYWTGTCFHLPAFHLYG
jgi:hypothetical protein